MAVVRQGKGGFPLLHYGYNSFYKRTYIDCHCLCFQAMAHWTVLCTVWGHLWNCVCPSTASFRSRLQTPSLSGMQISHMRFVLHVSCWLHEWELSQGPIQSKNNSRLQGIPSLLLITSERSVRVTVHPSRYVLRCSPRKVSLRRCLFKTMLQRMLEKRWLEVTVS